MRGFLQFLVVMVAIFFVVGEFFGGWYLGIPPQTPMLLYKKDHYVMTQSRRTTVAEEFAFSMTGKVSRGTVTVEGYYERPASFQTGARGSPEYRVFQATFHEGETVNVSHVMRQGGGIYSVRVVYDDTTGVFRLTLPPPGTL